MGFRTILKKLDFMAECKKYGLGFWQCPNSLFLVMGVIIITAMILTYFIGIHFVEPEVVIAIVSVVTIVLLIIGHSLVNSFTRVVEANRMKSEFVSIVSHQLRTPLSALKWSLDLLRSKRLGEFNQKQKEYLDIVNESGAKMIKLVNDLLNVSRIEQGRVTMQFKSFSVGELIEETVKELELLAEAHQVKIQFKDDKKLPNVYSDPDKIRMVIQNLIDNAVKYSKKEEGWVRVGAEKDEKNKKRIRVNVEDNGLGIPSFLQKQVFGKFFRGENLVRQKVEGTGLGLFIAKGFVKICGGDIGFKSQEGKGSTFWFTIPIANK
ncbi:MAG: sensor histidine kinase [Patescibacteria group bacterium]